MLINPLLRTCAVKLPNRFVKTGGVAHIVEHYNIGASQARPSPQSLVQLEAVNHVTYSLWLAYWVEVRHVGEAEGVYFRACRVF
jgi:hypothetical protein